VRNREIANSMMAFNLDMKYILRQEADIKEFMMEAKKWNLKSLTSPNLMEINLTTIS
jgi:hypothetical protein